MATKSQTKIQSSLKPFFTNEYESTAKKRKVQNVAGDNDFAHSQRSN